MGKKGANECYRQRQLDRAVRGVNTQGIQIDSIHYCLNLVMDQLGLGSVEMVSAARMAQDLLNAAVSAEGGASSSTAAGAMGMATWPTTNHCHMAYHQDSSHHMAHHQDTNHHQAMAHYQDTNHHHMAQHHHTSLEL